ncbi:septation ring formation regulator EzrA-like isoform X1 [Cyprinodon tularosa]|uniref:septation ring formation regulator EzrA-like isoform X1 n=1 Tax=Cyprinodon tularosa TaxID=77115 RepID=UPI0018E2536D|nr:septation ring formation regulator EzrA-like isoform X1 [Cyprinodon tularosa]
MHLRIFKHLFFRSELKQKEDELESVNKRLTETKASNESEIQKIRSALEEKQGEVKSANQRMIETKTSLEKELHQVKSELKQKEDELESVNKRLTETKASNESEIQKIRSALEEKQGEVKSANQRMIETKTSLEKELHQVKSELKQKEDELESVNKRLTETKASNESEIQKIRSALEEKQGEVKSANQRLQEAPALRSSPQHCKSEGCEHKQSLTEMDKFYKKQLYKARSAAEQKEKELKSVKDRLAAQVAISLKTGNTESMNNPVSKTRLTEMYDNLRLLQWPNIKDRLKSRKIGPKEAKDLIQRTFGDAAEEMKRRKQQIEEVFQETRSSSGPTPQKVKEYRQLTVQSLQMALFHTSKEDLFKTGFLEHGGQFPEEVKEDLRLLASECYWLGCLMALNNPPLQPDWKNHFPGFDSWDIFPRDIQPFVL